MPVRVTKRRPWWSDRRFGLTALLCALSLTFATPPAGAASNKPSAMPAAAKHKSGAASKPKKISPAPRRSAAIAARDMGAEVGLADILERERSGLRGHASFYGQGFHGRRTATGERFDIRQFTGASNHFPLGSKVAVRRLDNDRCAVVLINDRMHARHRKRVIDVSRGVAEYLDMIRAGVVLVRVAPIKASGAVSGSALARQAATRGAPRASRSSPRPIGPSSARASR